MEPSYLNREIDAKFDELKELLGDIGKVGTNTLAQTTKTNGRVTQLEMDKVSMESAINTIFKVSYILAPIILALIMWGVTQYIPQQIQLASHQAIDDYFSKYNINVKQ